jgi:hypothetical protein
MSERNLRSTQFELSGLTQWLIRHAAQLAPDTLYLRLEEEWLADLQARSSAMSRLRFALGCCWATVVIADEFPEAQVAAA